MKKKRYESESVYASEANWMVSKGLPGPYVCGGPHPNWNQIRFWMVLYGVWRTYGLGRPFDTIQNPILMHKLIRNRRVSDKLIGLKESFQQSLIRIITIFAIKLRPDNLLMGYFAFNEKIFSYLLR